MNDYGFPPKFPEEGKKNESKHVRTLFPCFVSLQGKQPNKDRILLVYMYMTYVCSVLCKTLTLSGFVKGQALSIYKAFFVPIF